MCIMCHFTTPLLKFTAAGLLCLASCPIGKLLCFPVNCQTIANGKISAPPHFSVAVSTPATELYIVIAVYIALIVLN